MSLSRGAGEARRGWFRRTLHLRYRLKQLNRRLALSGLRESDFGLIVFGAALGAAVGLAAVLLHGGVSLLHMALFDVPLESHLSAETELDWWRVLLVPCLGGLAVGAATWLARRWRNRELVDPVEANALYGGRMSLRDSLVLGLLSILSDGVGASVGMEAAYSQVGAALGSKLGLTLAFRRDDVRTMVGCGAAAAIAAAFNAPLAGAFYAFELILGSYTLTTLAPVAVASLMGALTARAMIGTAPVFVVYHAVTVGSADYAFFVLLGLAAGGLAILVMRGVTRTEAWFRGRAVPIWARPVLGGALVAGIATVFPQVLGSGHGAILSELRSDTDLKLLVGLLVAKAVASAVSIGAGFRGGLFSSSLFMGSLFGSAAAALIDRLGGSIDQTAYTLVGMGALAAGIIGAPLTMIFLVLETTGDFSASIGVMAGVIAASVAVRRWFGYSFATWRFHLRGLRITSPEDIAWAEALSVAKLMRRDAPVVPAAATIEAVRKAFPIGRTKQAFAIDADGQLVGTIDLAEVHSPDLTEPQTRSAAELIHAISAYLTPELTVREALLRFQAAATEVLAVVDDAQQRHVIGYLSEAYALRQYNHELESHRGTPMGSAGIFSPPEEMGGSAI